MFIEQLDQNMEETWIGVWGRKICVFFVAGRHFLAPLFLYICFETLVSILQNSPSLSWQNLFVPCKIHISFISHRLQLNFGGFIGLCVLNPKKLGFHQSDFFSSIYESWNGQRSTSVDCKIWLWIMRFPCLFLFYFFRLSFTKRYGC